MVCNDCKKQIKSKFSYYVSYTGEIVRDVELSKLDKYPRRLPSYSVCYKCAKRQLMLYKLAGVEFEEGY